VLFVAVDARDRRNSVLSEGRANAVRKRKLHLSSQLLGGVKLWRSQNPSPPQQHPLGCFFVAVDARDRRNSVLSEGRANAVRKRKLRLSSQLLGGVKLWRSQNPSPPQQHPLGCFFVAVFYKKLGAPLFAIRLNLLFR